MGDALELTDDQVLDGAARWLRAGKAVALATVVRTWGSSPRPAGSHLVVNENGEFLGSVSGGCVETAVVQAARAVLAGDSAQLIDFGVSDEQAWEAGLSCGGRIQLFIGKINACDRLFGRLREARRTKRCAALVTRLGDGAQAFVCDDLVCGALELTAQGAQAAREFARLGRCGSIADATLFIRGYAPPLRLLIIGAVHISQLLAPLAALTGFEVVIIDPREAFANAVRFPAAELRIAWPDQALAELAPDERTAVVTLSHDPRIDDPALQLALRSPAFYVGSLGSRRTHTARLERLRALGLDGELERIHAPVGLDLGGREPAEIAVATLAQIIQARHGSGGR